MYKYSCYTLQEFINQEGFAYTFISYIDPNDIEDDTVRKLALEYVRITKALQAAIDSKLTE